MAADTFTCTRSTVIAAPAAAVLAEVADLRRHEAWSPFSKPDPKRTSTYAGAPGVGQSHSFAGGQGGAGRIVIDSVEPHRVIMTLTMLKPVKTVNTVTFALEPQADGVRVTWSMTGPMTLMGRIMGLFIDTDAMCRKMFEQGLANLKTLVEPEGVRLAA